MDILGIGALNLDFIYDVEDLGLVKAGLPLEEGEEMTADTTTLPILRGKLNLFGSLRKVSPGGSASNTCFAMARMGFEAGIAGVLGRDKEAEFYLKESAGIDTTRVVRKEKTGCAYIVNGRNKDRSIVVFPGSNSDLEPEDVNFDALFDAKWIHMSSYVSQAGLRTQRRVRERIAGILPFSIDPGEIYAQQGRRVHPLIDGAEILFMGEREAEKLFSAGIEEALRQALGLVKMVVVKRGKEGASLFTRDATYHVEADAVGVVDNTGAGDVLNGAFLWLHMRGIAPGLALAVAVKAAGRSVTGYGRDAYPTQEEVEVLYEDMLVHHRKG